MVVLTSPEAARASLLRQSGQTEAGDEDVDQFRSELVSEGAIPGDHQFRVDRQRPRLVTALRVRAVANAHLGRLDEADDEVVQQFVARLRRQILQEIAEAKTAEPPE